MKKFLFLCSTASIALLASSCSIPTDGPLNTASRLNTIVGRSTEYYYSPNTGATYVYSNTEKIYDANGNVVSTITGVNDTVRTLGYSGSDTPEGDSLFAASISYRVLSSYATPNPIDEYYTSYGFVPSTSGGSTPMIKRPRPVSTDTILAGCVGKVRTDVGAFGTGGSYTWKCDTIYYAYHDGNVYLWQLIGTAWVQQRHVLAAAPSTNDYWSYDLDDGAPTVTYTVLNDNKSLTVSAGSYSNCAEIGITNSEISSYGFYSATKDFANNVGPIRQYDRWTESSDGINYHDVSFEWQLTSYAP